MKAGRLFLCAVACSGLVAGAGAAGADSDEGWGESPFLTDRGDSRSVGLPADLGEPQVRLQGILWDPQAPTAIVNNRVVAPGDSVGGWEVTEIQQDHVVLSDGSTSRTLRAE